MIIVVRQWLDQRSERERRLLLVMLLIAVPVLLWLAVFLPVASAMDRARERYQSALERHGRVVSRASALSLPRAAPGPQLAGDLSLVVTEAAQQRGLALASVSQEGPDRVSLSISGAAPAAVTQWLAELEGRGVVIVDLRLTPATTGLVSVTAQLARTA